MSKKQDIDAVSGIETTGHEWDGLKELNNPLPRWWLWTFYATILWAIGYMIAFPAWPTLTGYTKGVLGYSQRAVVAQQIKDARAAQGKFREEIEKLSVSEIAAKPELLRFAVAGGRSAYFNNCEACHGRVGLGSSGYPNLSDDDWLWGGKIEEIEHSIRFGIRSGHDSQRTNDMPKFGEEQLLTEAQINDLAELVLNFTGAATDPAAVERAKTNFAEQCAACHGEDGKGKAEFGAPNLTDAIWLYGKSKESIIESINTGRGGVMPAWTGELDEFTIKLLTVYVHSMGGGK